MSFASAVRAMGRRQSWRHALASLFGLAHLSCVLPSSRGCITLGLAALCPRMGGARLVGREIAQAGIMWASVAWAGVAPRPRTDGALLFRYHLALPAALRSIAGDAHRERESQCRLRFPSASCKIFSISICCSFFVKSCAIIKLYAQMNGAACR